MSHESSAFVATQARPSPIVSWSRVGNGTVLAIIAISVFAQLLVFAHALRGDIVGDLVPEEVLYLNMAVVPGSVLAIIKLVLMLMRRIWHVAALYLLIVVLPYVGWIAVARTSVAESSHALTDSEQVTEEFLLGQDWARHEDARSHSQCNGTHEFNRGCREAVTALLQEDAGEAWAGKNRPQRPSQCVGEPSFVVGCQRDLLENADYLNRFVRPYDAFLNAYVIVRPTSTDECVREVNAVFEVQTVRVNRRNMGGADRRAWDAELHKCEAIDFRGEHRVIADTYRRLSDALVRLHAGHGLSGETRRQIEADYAAVFEIRDQAYRMTYLELFDQYSASLTKLYRVPVIDNADPSCEQYQSKINVMRLVRKYYSDRVLVLKANPDQPEAAAEVARLHQQQKDMSLDWHRIEEGAKARGCLLSVGGAAP